MLERNFLLDLTALDIFSNFFWFNCTLIFRCYEITWSRVHKCDQSVSFQFHVNFLNCKIWKLARNAKRAESCSSMNFYLTFSQLWINWILSNISLEFFSMSSQWLAFQSLIQVWRFLFEKSWWAFPTSEKQVSSGMKKMRIFENTKMNFEFVGCWNPWQWSVV